MKKILLSSIVAIALLSGCTEEKKVVDEKPLVTEQKVEVKVQTPKTQETKTPEAQLVEQVKESTSKLASQVVEESKKVAAIGSEAVKSVSDQVLVKTEEVTKDVVSKAIETKDKIEESINNIVATKTEAEASDASLVNKGKGLYLKCAGCHGANGQMAALGKSQIIKGWDAEKIIASLQGYKDDTYGGVMKGVMKGQVANLSDEEISALGAYISTF